VTGITNFGIFVQLKAYLVDGLIRYEHLMDDWWDVDERSGVVRGQRTGTTIGIGDVVNARIAKVDVPRRELDLAIIEVVKRTGRAGQPVAAKKPGPPAKKGKGKGKQEHRGGSTRRNRVSNKRRK
jgi:ribonuclease R